MVMISQRPAEIADRAVPGHWEGDLLIGKDCKSAVGTLVERTTRYVMLLHLPAGRDARLVEQAMRQAITGLPGELARTITWDRGKEMAFHAQPQQPAPQDPRVHDTIRTARRVPCAHRLNPPCQASPEARHSSSYRPGVPELFLACSS
jgi:hypothetical protein